MIRKVLIVDDDHEMLLSLKEGLERYGETFSVLTAGNGLMATQKLKENPISLVVSDLKMPEMDGFALLSHIMENYPGIPVIIMTGYSTPEMESSAMEGGAVGYIEKPFMVDSLARKILVTMRKESDGGTLHGISSGMFLQFIEMEQKTCTIRLVDQFSKRQGVLFFKEGELLDARINGLQGLKAAYEIFSWDDVTLSIQNICALRKKKIQVDIQAILLEAMRLKDEKGEAFEPAGTVEDEPRADPFPKKEGMETAGLIESIRSRLQKEMGKRSGLEEIYQDSSWDSFMAKLAGIGSSFDAGRLEVVYVDRGEATDFVLLPGKVTTVLSMNPKCPKDRVLRVLNG